MGLADYLSRNPSNDATPISTYNYIFSVAKINSIRTALGFPKNNATRGTHLGNNTSRGPQVTNNNQSPNDGIAACKVLLRDTPVEGVESCERKWTNQKQENCMNRQLRKTNENFVVANTHSERSYTKLLISNNYIKMDGSLKNMRRFLKNT